MTIVSNFLEFNKQFVEQKQYEEYLTDKYPDKK